MRLRGQPAADHQRLPAAETGSAISFYRLARTIAYAAGSALSATLLMLSIPAPHLPAWRLSTAALVCPATFTSR